MILPANILLSYLTALAVQRRFALQEVVFIPLLLVVIELVEGPEGKQQQQHFAQLHQNNVKSY